MKRKQRGVLILGFAALQFLAVLGLFGVIEAEAVNDCANAALVRAAHCPK